MICLYHGAIIYVCNSALSSYIHITTVEVFNLINLEGCLPAAEEVAAPWWHRAPNMKNFDHHWHEFYKVLYSLRLSRWCLWWLEKENALNQEDSDCNFNKSDAGSMTSGQPPMLSAEWVLFNIINLAKPLKMQHVFMFSNLMRVAKY